MIFSDIYRGRRVLVTGHTGFKGSWLCTWLIKLGAEVAGYSVDVPTEPSNFDLLRLSNRMHHHLGDIRDMSTFAKVVDDFRPEFIFHMAAQALVRKSYDDPRETFEVNVMGMVNVLDCIRDRPWIQVAVLVTSDKAYRNDEWCWGYRETDVLAGKDPYSGSKSCADLAAFAYFESFLKGGATQVAITRAGNVIGGGDWAADRIVPDCMRAWSSGDTVLVRSPKATRPWQHVLEPLSGYLLLGASLYLKKPKLHCEAFNFGPDARVNQTVEQLITSMQLYWPDAKWAIPDGFENGGYEANLLKLSCDKALAYLDWSATLSFSETVSLTVDWYLNWIANERDIFLFTSNQIDEYCYLASTRGSVWSIYD